jgi:hypothetical protein
MVTSASYARKNHPREGASRPSEILSARTPIRADFIYAAISSVLALYRGGIRDKRLPNRWSPLGNLGICDQICRDAEVGCDEKFRSQPIELELLKAVPFFGLPLGAFDVPLPVSTEIDARLIPFPYQSDLAM